MIDFGRFVCKCSGFFVPFCGDTGRILFILFSIGVTILMLAFVPEICSLTGIVNPFGAEMCIGTHPAPFLAASRIFYCFDPMTTF